MVFMQCECDPAQYREEVSWVTGMAKSDNRISGIVSWAPLEKGPAAGNELRELASNPLVRGVRRIIQFEEDLEFCLRPDFIAGVNLLPELGLTFDICISHIHIANTIRFVAQCPEVKFILDHIGKPDIKGRRLEPWQSEMKTLSEFPNVYCKVSSLATEADQERWTRADLEPYVKHVYECFGFDRVVFAGDWPVSSQAAHYPLCVELAEDFARSCGADEPELRKLFWGNAVEFYGL